MKNQVKFETISNGKQGCFYVDHDTPIGIVKEMLFQFQKEIGMIEDQIKAQQEAQAAQKKTEEEAGLTTDEAKEDKVEALEQPKFEDEVKFEA